MKVNPGRSGELSEVNSTKYGDGAARIDSDINNTGKMKVDPSRSMELSEVKRAKKEDGSARIDNSSDDAGEINAAEQPVNDTRWYSVDMDMLPAKATYFFDQAKEASLWPYLVLFQVSIGLTPAQAGIVNGLRFVGCLFGAPLWGMLADQKKIHRPLILFICAMAIVTQCSQPLLGKGFGPKDKNVCPTRSNESFIKAEHEQENKNTTNTKLFYSLLAISIVASSFDGATLTFADSGVQRKIKSLSRKIDFGRQRLFGSIGYAVGSLVSSAVIKYFPHLDISCYMGMFCVFLSFSFCLMLSFNQLFKGSRIADEESADFKKKCRENNPAVKKIMWQTLKKWDCLFFLATVLFNGLVRALVFSFTFLYLTELEAPTMLLGYSMVVSQAASMVFYALAQIIIDVVGGTMRVMCISCASWIIRLMCLAYLKDPFLILPINVLNGISASLFVAASIIHVRQICAPAAFTTMYGLRNALFNGGGYIIANVVGGELYQLFGARKLFFDTCIICSIWTTLMIVYLIVKKCQSTRKIKDETIEDVRNNNIATIAKIA